MVYVSDLLKFRSSVVIYFLDFPRENSAYYCIIILKKFMCIEILIVYLYFYVQTLSLCSYMYFTSLRVLLELNTQTVREKERDLGH